MVTQQRVAVLLAVLVAAAAAALWWLVDARDDQATGVTSAASAEAEVASAEVKETVRDVAIQAGVQDSPRQQTAEFFAQTDVYNRMREVFQDANRNNASIYSLDPRGLAVFAYDIDDVQGGPPPSFAGCVSGFVPGTSPQRPTSRLIAKSKFARSGMLDAPRRPFSSWTVEPTQSV